MKKEQLIGLTIALTSFLIGILLFRNIDLPPFVSLSIIIAGGLLFVKAAYSRFGPKVAIYGSLGFFFVFIKYVITNLFLRKNPLLISAILMLLTVLSLIFIGLSLYYMFKQKDKFIK